MAGDAPPSPEAARDGRVEHAPDFAWLRVGEKRYDFRRSQQRNTIEYLYRAWEKGGDGAGAHEDTIGDALDPEASRGKFRVANVFRGHEALRVILKSVGKGVWALSLGGKHEAQ